MRRSLFVLPFVAALWTGCAGYVLGPIKPKRYANIKTIAINSFANETLEPRVEVLLADSLLRELQRDGTYRITDAEHADAIVDGTLQILDRRAGFNVIGNVLLAKEYTLTLRARYSFKRRTTGEVLEDRAINGVTSFFVSGSSAIAADVNQDERQALPNAADDLAQRLAAQLTEGW